MNYSEQIDKNAHYFILMHFLEKFGPIVFTSDSTREKWGECEVIEDRYKLYDNYKVEYYARMTKELNTPYARQFVYTSDNHLTVGFNKKLLI